MHYKFHFQLHVLQKCLPVLTEDSLCTRYQIYIYIYISLHSNRKTKRLHDITEILLKVALNPITLTLNDCNY